MFSTVIVVAFGASAVAAHAVVLRLSGVLYAFALGLSQAVTVRVALGAGAGNAERIASAVGAALALACVIALVELAALWIFAERIAALFITNGSHAASTAAPAALLIVILAPAEAIGSIGTTAIGALRGVGDTRVPMARSLAALWGVGFCIAMYLAFEREMGVAGYWIGLLAGTVVLSAACVVRMWRRLLPRRGDRRNRRSAGSRTSLAARW
ncbi:MAG: MATE family efflux transporter [Gammaproteobacteria bacterium]|nr:MATE family efflux transporter [Gammaproteobacteria bacterium]